MYWAFCEAHILATFSSASSPNCCARSPVWMAWTTSRPASGICERLLVADLEDLLLLDGLLGVTDPDTPAPQIDPDAWRRRVVR